MDRAWSVRREGGTAGALHARSLPEPLSRAVSVLTVERPALVLGSTQPEGDADGAALASAGVELVRRRSGGGAVLLVPGESLWVDVLLPRGDPLWSDDVGVAFEWLGLAWVAALRRFGVDAEAHHGPLVLGAWGRRVCFAGLGPGEVTVDGRKVVGMAQRRERAGARFQCTVLRRWDPSSLLALLALEDHQRAAGASALRDIATGLDLPGSAVVDALVEHLPA